MLKMFLSPVRVVVAAFWGWESIDTKGMNEVFILATSLPLIATWTAWGKDPVKAGSSPFTLIFWVWNWSLPGLSGGLKRKGERLRMCQVLLMTPFDFFSVESDLDASDSLEEDWRFRGFFSTLRDLLPGDAGDVSFRFLDTPAACPLTSADEAGDKGDRDKLSAEEARSVLDVSLDFSREDVWLVVWRLEGTLSPLVSLTLMSGKDSWQLSPE